MAFPSDLVRTKNWGTETLTDSDLEGQFDLIINWVMAALDNTSGHDHSGSNKGKAITLAASGSGVTGTLPIANGGTGLTSYAAGDTIYASAENTLGKLAKGTGKQLYRMNAAATAPEWVDPVAIQAVNTTSGSHSAISTTIPYDNTVPQNTEGTEVMTRSITPQSATNILKIDVVVFIGGATVGAQLIAALFYDSVAGAIAVGTASLLSNSSIECISFSYWMVAGTTSSMTFKVRAAANSGNSNFNGENSGGAKFGGAFASSITITEFFS